ncbi:MAG: hypothetical protein CTY37_01745 [Methylotenera sp.]|nr:hypothetical protein [Methylotenera sp.]OQW68560.1 MAG: hypothetical protein BVN34_07625 [Proteobacteria bacterium ST_bin12]PPC88162.1 MAG: hypothetical protein CTY37_01745 [Methylotenera sp.]PPD57221.1 MAG: hypothetical protein CTY10_00145 [Methylotenera sp.]
MSVQTSKGAMLALGAAALILSGCAGAGTKTAANDSNVACVGVNSCKGTSDCKTAATSCKGQNACKTAKNACKGQGSCASAANACKGQNACAGHGHLSLSAAECDAKGGHAV